MKTVLKQFFVFWFLLFYSPIFFSPLAQSVEITGSSFETLEDGNALFYQAQFFSGKYKISADQILYKTIDQLLFLKGNIVLQTEEYIILTQEMSFDVKKEQFIAKRSSIYLPSNQYYGRVEELELENGFLSLKSFTITPCDPKDPPVEFYFNSILIHESRFSTGFHSIFYFYNVPLFYTPILPLNLRSDRHSGFLFPSITKNDSSDPARHYGNRYQFSYFLAFDFDHDLTITPDYMTKRGLAWGLEYNYAFTEGMRGKVNYWGLYENITPRQPDEETGMEESDNAFLERGFLEYQHRQHYLLNSKYKVYFYLEYKKNSDNELREDFFNDQTNFLLKNSIFASSTFRFNQSFLSIYAEEKSYFTESSRYLLEDDSNSISLLKPTLHFRINGWFFDMLGVELKTEWSKFSRKEGWAGFRSKNQFQLSLPFRFLEVDIIPTLNIHSNLYQADYQSLETLSPSDNFISSQETTHTYSSFEMEFFQQYQRLFFSEEGWADFQLLFRPTLRYVHVPDFLQRDILALTPSQNKLNQTATDYRTYDTLFGGKELVYAYDLLELGFGFTLNHKKEKNGVPSQILDFQIRQPIDLNRTTDSSVDLSPNEGPSIQDEYHPIKEGEVFLPMVFEFRFTPDKNLTFDLFHRYQHQDQYLTEKKYSFQMQNAYRDSLKIQYWNNTETYQELNGDFHYQTNQFSFDAGYYPMDNLHLFTRLAWNFDRLSYTDPKYVDTQLTSFRVGFRKKSCCYQWGLSFQKQVKESSINNVTQEYFEKTIELTFSLLGEDLNYLSTLNNE